MEGNTNILRLAGIKLYTQTSGNQTSGNIERAIEWWRFKRFI